VVTQLDGPVISPMWLRGRLWRLGFVAAMLFALPAAAGDVWLDVDTAARSLQVIEGGKVLLQFDNLSVGRNGVTREKTAKDRRTPLGSYRVRRINTESRFHIYFGFDYPNLEQAMQAFRSRRIDYEQLKSIRNAHYRGVEPPADTPLGGYIGIHGLGQGDPRIHEDYNWTNGCIALTNEQVDELAHWVRIGTRVEVH